MIFLLLDISQCFGKKGELYYMIENAQPLCRHLLIHVSIATGGQTIHLEGFDLGGKMSNDNEAGSLSFMKRDSNLFS